MSRQRTARDTDINTFTGTEMNPYIVDVPTNLFDNLFGKSKNNKVNETKEDMQINKNQADLEKAAIRARDGIAGKMKRVNELKQKNDNEAAKWAKIAQDSQLQHDELVSQNVQYTDLLTHTQRANNTNENEGGEDGK